jgi:hypothetical protein
MLRILVENVKGEDLLEALGSFTLHFGLKYEIIYQLDAIEYCTALHCSATRHQHTHSSGPTPNYTKDTICCMCKEIVISIAPEDRRISPKHVELKEHK